jgi:hypothetical protein
MKEADLHLDRKRFRWWRDNFLLSVQSRLPARRAAKPIFPLSLSPRVSIYPRQPAIYVSILPPPPTDGFVAVDSSTLRFESRGKETVNGI